MILSDKIINYLSNLEVHFIGNSGKASDIGMSSLEKGDGYDFAEYRNFVPGDDIRNLDYCHYAAKQILVIKEKDKVVVPDYFIYVDLSDSVLCNGESLYDRIIEMVNSIVFLLSRYYVKISFIINDGAGDIQIIPCPDIDFLNDIIDKMAKGGNYGAANLKESICKLYDTARLILISDMICPAGHEAIIETLENHVNSCILFNVYLDNGYKTIIAGSNELVDSEEGSSFSINIDESALTKYTEIRNNYYNSLRFCAEQRNWIYYELNSSVDFEQNINNILFNNKLYL